MRYKTIVGDQAFDIEINRNGEVIVDGRRVPVDFRWLEGNSILSLLTEHKSHEALVEGQGDDYNVLLHGRMFNVHVEDERAQRLRRSSRGFAPPSGETAIRAPMPGLVVTVPVAVGQAVWAGDILIILESMKMENEIKTPRDGKVTSIRVRPRQAVEANQVLLVLA